MMVLRIGLAGVGAVGAVVGRLLADTPEVRIAAAAVRDEDKARAALPSFDGVFTAPGELHRHADVVVEGLPGALFREVAEPTLRAGRILVPLSIGQLLSHWDLVETAGRDGGRIVAPTGALIGLDAVRAAAEGEIQSVTMTTRKPPGGLVGAPYLEEHGIEVMGIGEPLRVYAGSVRAAAAGFPANLNVAAALSLAGIGPDRTQLEVWADPTVSRNMHSIKVEADSANFSMAIENVPSEENPRTGKITALSTVAAIRTLYAPLRVGS
ncbi:MAG: aspartate dehydrogenase [Pseudomonadota bacterium]